jgi:hypothetical protein
MVGSLIAFVLGNFTLTFFVVGLVFSAVGIVRAPRPRATAVVIEKLLSWFVFWTIGVLYLYNAVFHIFFGEMAAAFIGWTDSPFQFEVGTASLASRPSDSLLRSGASTADSRQSSAPASSCSVLPAVTSIR